MKKSSVLGGLAFAAILGSVLTFPAYAKEKTFPEGIYAGGFALGGLTKEQAETQFAAYISGLEERSVTLDVAGNGLETTAKELGYTCKNDDALQEAEDMKNSVAGHPRGDAHSNIRRAGSVIECDCFISTV